MALLYTNTEDVFKHASAADTLRDARKKIKREARRDAIPSKTKNRKDAANTDRQTTSGKDCLLSYSRPYLVLEDGAKVTFIDLGRSGGQGERCHLFPGERRYSTLTFTC